MSREAWLQLAARPGRTLATAVGIAVGTGLIVATLGLAQSATTQVSGRFDALAANRITVTQAPNQQPVDSKAPRLPADSAKKASRIHGVVSAGGLVLVPGKHQLSGNRVVSGSTSINSTVVAATTGLNPAIGGHVQGSWLSEYEENAHQDVAVLGSLAASQLGISNIQGGPAVLIDGKPYLVIGLLDDPGQQADLLADVIIPYSTAGDRWHLDGLDRLVVQAQRGSADVVGEQVGVAISPGAPKSVTVAVPVTPTVTRGKVAGDLKGLLLVLGAVALAISVLSITNVMLVTVLEREPEFGLRRALGARTTVLVLQVLLEAAGVGCLGGVLGSLTGMLSTSAVALAQGWRAVMSPAVPIIAPLIGAGIGLIAGTYPALRAARIEPIAALRRST